MDKGLIKIQELELELKKLSEELKQIDEKTDTKKVRIGLIEEKIKYFDRNKKFAESEKKSYYFKKRNIEKWEKKTFIKTTIMFLIVGSIIALVNKFFLFAATPDIIAIILNLTMILTGGKFALKYGESNDYYIHKKYLENNSLEKINQKIFEHQQEYNKECKKQETIKSEMIELNNKKEDIIYNVNLLKNKIESLKNVRTNIINEYIENNNELEELLNEGYESIKILELK